MPSWHSRTASVTRARTPSQAPGSKSSPLDASSRTRACWRRVMLRPAPCHYRGRGGRRRPLEGRNIACCTLLVPGPAIIRCYHHLPMSGGESTGANGIEVEGLVRDFKGGVRAVDGIDLQVAPGEIYGFLGPNGAGKSTTVLVLTTLLPPTAGKARVAGLDVVHQGAEVRRAIGASLQESALDPFLTGREHMRLQSALHGLGKAERERRGTELLERVGLTHADDRKVGGYSGGMKRRLDLALALVHRPRLLFLDEPTTGLDVQSRTALWDEVRRLAADGVTVFLTTQYLEEADVLAHRVGIIDHGRIVAEGTPTELKAAIGRPSVEAVPADPGDRERLAPGLARFGEEAAAAPNAVATQLPEGVSDLAEIVRTLDGEGIAIADLRLHAPTLDDVFLAKTGRSLEGAGGDGEDDDGADGPKDEQRASAAPVGP